MPDRDRFAAMMLEHIYGLLEADDVRELEAFLATPEGAELKAQGERWRAQLAGAAKDEFPRVHFTAPATGLTASPAPSPAKVPAATAIGGAPRPTIPAVWTKWGLAASVLLLLGLGLPAAIQFIGWYRQSGETQRLQLLAKTEAENATKVKLEHNARRETVLKEFNAARDAHDLALKNYQESLMNARKAIEQKDFMVRLEGPNHIQPGAPNEWKIQTLNRQHAPAFPKKIEVVVKDQANKELLREAHDRPQTPPSLKIPTSFWQGVQPGAELFLEVVAYTDDNRKSVLAEKVPLARPVYVTHLATDKPLYKPSETIRFRSLTLDRATFLPPEQDMFMKFRLKTPEGALIELDEGNGRVMDGVKPVLGPDRKPVRGIGAGEYELSADAPGGEYALMVYERNTQTGREEVLETRKFIVNRYVPDVFEKKLEFDAKSYGAGDYVQARIEASRTAGGELKGARVSIVALMDGKAIHTSEAKLDAKGVHNLRFKLPADVGNGNISLSVNIADGTDSEVINRPVPVVGSKLHLEFYPEGGDMVAGVPGRVYFQVKTPQGKPADLKGIITDGKDTIAEVATVTDADQPGVNRGQGVFILTPKANAKYYLQVQTPVGIKTDKPEGFPLPDVKSDGVVLSAIDAVTEKGDAIRVNLQVGQGDKVLHVGAYARGRLIDHKRIDIRAGKRVEVALQGDAKLGGVTRVTVFEEPKNAGEGRANLIPRAERLLYRKPSEQLHLNITPDRARYTPAANVNLDLAAFTEKETPTPAILMVGVVNQSVIRMADNKTDRLLPTHFLVGGEVKSPSELEHADFLLTDHPKAAIALDLLLGTQGWRRFAEQSLPPMNPADRPDVDRMLVAHGQRTAAPTELYRLEEQRVNAEFQPKLEQALLRLNDAEWTQAEYQAKEAGEFRQREQQAEAIAGNARNQYEEAAAELYNFEVQNRNLRGLALPFFLAGLILFATATLVVLVLRNQGERKPYYIAGGASFALALLVVGGLIATRPNAEHERYNAMRRPHDRFAAVATRADMPAPAMEADMAAGARERVEAMPADDRFNGNRDGVRPQAPRGPAMKADPQAVPPMAVLPPGVPKPKVAENKLLEKADKAHKDAAKEMEELAKKQMLGGDLDKKKAGNAQAKQLQDQMRRKQAAMGKGGAANGRLNAPMMPGGGFGGFPPPPPGGFGGGGRGAGPAAGMPFPGELQMMPVMPQAMPFVVREYAHQRDPSLNDVRSDFTETVYWHPVLVLPDNGKTTIKFQLNDDIARYQVLVAGHTTDGRIGAATRTIEARKPFTVDPKVPLEINSGDIMDVPVRIMNDSDDRRMVTFNVKSSNLSVEGGLPIVGKGDVKDSIDLLKNTGGRKVFRVRPSVLQGEALLVVEGQSEPAALPDQAARTLQIVPEGFPGVAAISDMLEKQANGTITLPKDMVPGTLKARVEVYPTSMADLVKGLEGLLREPGGCFEQTSTNNYPNTLILDYLNQTNQAAPEISKRAKDMLERGYGRLIAYECPDTPLKLKQGFEWFGGADMAHEALTAYGLLQFKDMARVTKVDAEMIKRTQAFLLSRKDGQGGFKRNSRALDSFGGAPKHTTDAYIVWALVESDPEDTEKLDLKKEIETLKEQAFKADSREGKDAYFVALVANTLLLRGEETKGKELLDRLKEKNLKAGVVTGGETSITRSGGRDLDIEVTALAMLGWMRANDAPKYGATVKEATKWLSQQRGGYGGFGSTQSTIMALKALITYAKKMAHPTESGEIVLTVDGKRIASKKFTKDDVEVIRLDLEKPEEIFKPGVQATVSLETDAKQAYPFALQWTYTTLTPVSAEKCAVTISTKLAKTEAVEGDTVPLSVTLENKLKTDHGMAVAVIGLPAGMKVPTDMKQLIDLREKGTISYFETKGRELVLYWRGLGPAQKIDLSVDLVCDVPGEYRGPASRGYLYYNADHKHWVEPLKIKIAAMAAKADIAAK